MDILISAASSEPIYGQIKNQIKSAILQGKLEEGEPLPSMRELAKNLQVSIITTKRAYEDLEKEGFVTSQVGKGTFVARQNPELLKEKQLARIEENLQQGIDAGKLIGLSLEELQQLVEVLYREER